MYYADVFVGPPSERASLLPDTDDEMVWTLQDSQDYAKAHNTSMFLVCHYKGTDKTITVKVPVTAKNAQCGLRVLTITITVIVNRNFAISSLLASLITESFFASVFIRNESLNGCNETQYGYELKVLEKMIMLWSKTRLFSRCYLAIFYSRIRWKK